MKQKIILLISCLLCLLVGFFLFPFLLGKKLNEEHQQITIHSNFGILDSLIIGTYHLDDAHLDSVLAVMCKQLKSTYEDAKDAGEAHVDLLDHIQYGREVAKRFNQLAIKNNSATCDL